MCVCAFGSSATAAETRIKQQQQEQTTLQTSDVLDNSRTEAGVESYGRSGQVGIEGGVLHKAGVPFRRACHGFPPTPKHLPHVGLAIHSHTCPTNSKTRGSCRSCNSVIHVPPTSKHLAHVGLAPLAYMSHQHPNTWLMSVLHLWHTCPTNTQTLGSCRSCTSGIHVPPTPKHLAHVGLALLSYMSHQHQNTWIMSVLHFCHTCPTNTKTPGSCRSCTSVIHVPPTPKHLDHVVLHFSVRLRNPVSFI